MAGMIGLSAYLGRGQATQDDYYVGGRNLPWWAVGISTMATQSGAISFISIPAFVALKADGGLRVLQYEFAVPLAMVFIMIFFIPFFRSLNLISVYEYLELRFNRAVRTFLSGVFLLSRGLATGVTLYAVSIVLSVVLGTDLVWTIVLIGVVTLIYDTVGGMKAVVYSDVVQLMIMLTGIGLCCYYAAELAGGWGSAIAAMAGDGAVQALARMIDSLGIHSDLARSILEQPPTQRLMGVDFASHGLGDARDTNFWALVFGGFFLYASYYGCDQSQTQRELSAPTLSDTKKSLFFNGFCRFPLVASYTAMGLFIAGALASSPDFQSTFAEWLGRDTASVDHMVPVFIVDYVPEGLRAIIFAAILAAAMSSLDSGLNSLSAATMRDFYEQYVARQASEKSYLLWSKLTTVLWGLFLIAVAVGIVFLPGKGTVLELINKVGSVFYGPILAAFLLGVAFPRATGGGVIAGIVAGVLGNAALALFAPGVSWWWWNLFGCAVTIGFALLASQAEPPPQAEKLEKTLLWRTDVWKKEASWLPRYAWLAGYFLFMVVLSLLPSWLAS